MNTAPCLFQGGVIDRALHQNLAKLALSEIVEMDDAVRRAHTMTADDNDTLIIVTSDHSHTLTIPGYLTRNMSIFGLSSNRC
jgi:alkaline phosphatase